MENKVKETREHVLWLRNAIKTFYPSFFYSPEEAIKQGIPTSYQGYQKTEILGHIFSITKTEDVSDALVVLDYWINLLDYPESDVPTYELLQNEVDPVIKEIIEVKEPEKRKRVAISIDKLQQRLKDLKRETPQPKELKEKIKYKESLTKPVSPIPQKVPSVIYLNSTAPPESNILSDEDRVRLENYIDEVRRDPNAFVENRVQEIIQYIPEKVKRDIPQGQLNFMARTVAIDITDKLLSIDKNSLGVAQINPSEILQSLTNPNNSKLSKIIPDENLRIQISQAARESIGAINNDSLTSQSLLEPVFGPNLAGYFYNTQQGIREHEISDIPGKNTNYQVSVQDLINHWKELANVKSKVFAAIKAENPEVAKQLTTKALDEIARKYSWYQKGIYGVKPLAGGLIPWVTSSANILGTTWKGAGIYKPLLGPFFTKSFLIGKAVYASEKGLVEIVGLKLGGIGVSLGKITLGNILATETPSTYSLAVLTKTGKKIFTGPLVDKVGKLLFKALTKIAPKIAATTAGAAAGAVAGTAIPIPIVGQIIGLVVGWIGGKVIPAITSWIKRHKESFIAIPVGMFALGLIFPGSLGALFRAGGFFTGAGYLTMRAGGIKPTGSLIGKGFQTFTYSIIHGVLPAIALPAGIALVSIPVVVALILYIINSGAYLVPPSALTEVIPGDGFPVECSIEKNPVSFQNNTSSKIADRGWKIVSDLYQGFWCYWNRSPGDFTSDVTLYPPSYPELFDEHLFLIKPNPTRDEMSVCGECMFWCTWLIQKAFRESGNNELEATLWSPSMQADFERRGKYIDSADASPNNVLPGSVVFFRVISGPLRTNHVGLVYTVSQDNLSFLQSNAGTKDGNIIFNLSGVGLQNLPGIEVVGIGLP